MRYPVALPVREEFTSWVERIHPEDRTATIARLQEAIEEGRQELQYTYRLLGPRGEFLSVWDHAFIVRGADWKPLSDHRPQRGISRVTKCASGSNVVKGWSSMKIAAADKGTGPTGKAVWRGMLRRLLRSPGLGPVGVAMSSSSRPGCRQGYWVAPLVLIKTEISRPFNSTGCQK